jgi:MoxR-like ATPase
MPIGDNIVESILNIVRAARPGDGASELVNGAVSWGPGPRAAQALSLAVRARALLDGRFAPALEDIHALARPILKHRMALGFAARADGLTVDDVITTILAQVMDQEAAA